MIVVSLMYVNMSLGLSSPKTPSEMAPIRPANSVFHRSIFVSLLGQAGIHVACMVYALRVAKAHSPKVCCGFRAGLRRVASRAFDGGQLVVLFVPCF